MRKLLKEFKEFALRGNVVDMAVGVIIGGAFSPIVTSLVNDIVMPPLGLLIGGVDFKDLVITIKQGAEGIDPVTINYGNFIQIVINFILIALCIFIVIKLINKLRDLTSKKEEAPAEPAAPAEPEPTKEEILLGEIRDLLKNK